MRYIYDAIVVVYLPGDAAADGNGDGRQPGYVRALG
jgi:hypothetical protein